MFKKQELTEEEIIVLDAIHSLIRRGELPFCTLEYLYKDPSYSKLIKDRIRKNEEKEHQYQVDTMESQVKRLESDIEQIRDELKHKETRLNTVVENLRYVTTQPSYFDDAAHKKFFDELLAPRGNN